MTYKSFSFVGIPGLAIAATLAFTPVAFAQTTTTATSNDSAPTASTTTPPASDSSATQPSTAIDATRGTTGDVAQNIKDGADRAAERAKRVYHSAKAKVEDTALDARVITALHDNKETHEADIHVSSDQGLVTLTGNVPNEGMAERAHDIAAQIIGVKEVRNELRYPNKDMNDPAHANEPESSTAPDAVGTENHTQAN